MPASVNPDSYNDVQMDEFKDADIVDFPSDFADAVKLV